MTVSVNISQLALQALRAGALHSHCNRNKSELYEVFHSFYEALFLYMYSAWKFRSLTITDFGPVCPACFCCSRCLLSLLQPKGT